MANNETEIIISDEEIEEMEEKMGEGAYTHIFKKPFQWEGKTYGQLTFDFESLKGKDILAVERELAAKNIFTVVRSLNVEFQIRIASRACTEKIGTDALEAMPIKDVERILNRVRGFFASAD